MGDPQKSIEMAAPPVYDAAADAKARPSPLTVADVPSPPAYHEQVDDPEEILQPTIFVLGNLFIHHESLSSSPVYQLSRVIHAQGRATNEIQLERLDHRVRTLSDGSPSVAARSKHIYTLQHYSVLFSEDFQCGIEAVSRKGVGTVAIKKSSFPHSGYRAARVPSDREKNFNKSAYIYAIKERKDVFEWFDAKGNVVATEDQRDGQHMLFVAVPLTRRTLDGLVALWCLWMWHVHVKDIPQPARWEHRKFILSLPRRAYSNSKHSEDRNGKVTTREYRTEPESYLNTCAVLLSCLRECIVTRLDNGGSRGRGILCTVINSMGETWAWHCCNTEITTLIGSPRTQQ